MIKVILIGLWICAVTIAGIYAGAVWQITDVGEDHAVRPKLTQFKVKPINVPVMTGGKVSGYLLAQFSYTAEAEGIKKQAIKPDVFIIDAAYKLLYDARARLADKSVKDPWIELAAAVKKSVNERYEQQLLTELLLDDFGYIPAESFRVGSATGRWGQGGSAKDREPSK